MKFRYQGTTGEIVEPKTTIKMVILTEVQQNTKSEKICNAISELFLSLVNENGFIVIQDQAYHIDLYGNFNYVLDLIDYEKLYSKKPEPATTEETPEVEQAPAPVADGINTDISPIAYIHEKENSVVVIRILTCRSQEPHDIWTRPQAVQGTIDRYKAALVSQEVFNAEWKRRKADKWWGIARVEQEQLQHSEREGTLTEQSINTAQIGIQTGYEELLVSGIVSTCRFCEYKQTITIPVEAGPEDIIAALEVSRGLCPECDERRREKSAEAILADLDVKPCFYATDGCKGEGKHQCPACKQWYCDEDHEMFLPIDNSNWAATALMCPQCHYNRYQLPKFAEGR